jgi:hypothetical protein
VADEPADHEVVGDHQFVPVGIAGTAEVFDRRTQGRGVLVALVLVSGIEPGEPPLRVLVTLTLRRHRRPVRREVAGVARHPREMAGQDIGGFGRPSQRTVVDDRKRHGGQPVAEPVRLLPTEFRQTTVRGVTGRLFAVADQVQPRASHRRPPPVRRVDHTAARKPITRSSTRAAALAS